MKANKAGTLSGYRADLKDSAPGSVVCNRVGGAVLTSCLHKALRAVQRTMRENYLYSHPLLIFELFPLQERPLVTSTTSMAASCNSFATPIGQGCRDNDPVSKSLRTTSVTEEPGRVLTFMTAQPPDYRHLPPFLETSSRPDCCYTRGALPISFGSIRCHESTGVDLKRLGTTHQVGCGCSLIRPARPT